MAVDLWMSCILMLDDLDLDARAQWVVKDKTNQRWMLSATKQTWSIKLAATVGLFFFFFFRSLDFANVYMAWPSCFYMQTWQKDAQVFGRVAFHKRKRRDRRRLHMKTMKNAIQFFSQLCLNLAENMCRGQFYRTFAYLLYCFVLRE